MTRLEPLIARLHALHPRLIDLSLDRLLRLLAQLGHPERQLPPVLHVAGTNGKGSTCAFLRAIAEEAGQTVHVYTSPHLVRFNERFRVAGALVSDERLATTLEQIERVNDGAPITVFEVMTAAAFVLFASEPADLCVLEVGLGGRGDATNVVTPAACAITSISLDHREMLGDTLALIAAEKAGIMKAGVPTVTGTQPAEVVAVLDAAGPVRARGRDWTIEPDGAGLRYRDGQGEVALPAPGLPGLHQVDNAGIAVATMRAAGFGRGGYGGIARADWPARLQRLGGRLAALAPGREVWLDGGHNPAGGRGAGRRARRMGRADARGRRHEAVQGHGRLSAAVAAARSELVGRGRAGAASGPAGGRDHPGLLRRGASRPDRGRGVAQAGRHAGPGADLWQPLSCRRGAEGRRVQPTVTYATASPSAAARRRWKLRRLNGSMAT